MPAEQETHNKFGHLNSKLLQGTSTWRVANLGAPSSNVDKYKWFRGICEQSGSAFFHPCPTYNSHDHVRFCFHRCPLIVCSNCLIASCAISWSRLLACRLSVLSGIALINYLNQFQMESWVGLQFGWTFKIIFVGIVLRVPLAVHKQCSHRHRCEESWTMSFRKKNIPLEFPWIKLSQVPLWRAQVFQPPRRCVCNFLPKQECINMLQIVLNIIKLDVEWSDKKLTSNHMLQIVTHSNRQLFHCTTCQRSQSLVGKHIMQTLTLNQALLVDTCRNWSLSKDLVITIGLNSQNGVIWGVKVSTNNFG